MEKNCGICKKAGTNNSNRKGCGYTIYTCVEIGYKYFEPIEKESNMEKTCADCKHCSINNGTGNCCSKPMEEKENEM